MSEPDKFFKVSSPTEIDRAAPILTGYEGRTIRLKLENGVEVGFATTTYGFSIPEEIRAYGARRIGMALELLYGLTNNQIQGILEARRKEGKDPLEGPAKG